MAEKKRKQVLLRLSPELYEELARWADDEFRSLNGQIEYLLTRAVREERRRGFGIDHVSDGDGRPIS